MSAIVQPAPLTFQDLAPVVPEEFTTEQRVRLWAEITDACEELLLAGLRREVGPDGDVIAAYRRWYAERTREHDRAMMQMLEKLAQHGNCRDG